MDELNDEDTWGMLMGHVDTGQIEDDHDAASPGGTAKPRFQTRLLTKVMHHTSEIAWHACL